MRPVILASLAAVGVALAAFAVPAHAEDATPLRVCLEEDSPPYSFKFKSRQGGYDMEAAGAVADKLGRPLQVQWFEFEIDEENSPKNESSALLSSGLCDLIAGFPMVSTMLGEPGLPAFTMPDHDGQKRSQRRVPVDLKPVAHTTPYNRSVLAIIAAPSVKKDIGGLADLEGLHLMAETASVSSAVLFRYKHRALVSDITHVKPSDGLLEQLEAGKADAAMIELHRFDWYKARHADTNLRWTGYKNPTGFNFGFAVLEENQDLLDKVNAAIAALKQEHAFEKIASEMGLTYVAPIAPDVAQGISLLD